jgi:hypothetical protein
MGGVILYKLFKLSRYKNILLLTLNLIYYENKELNFRTIVYGCFFCYD